MNSYIKLFGKDYTKKEFFFKVKKYVEKHTALVTTVFSGIITATVLFFNLLFTAYKIGELSYFSINISYAFEYDEHSIILILLLYISFAGILCFTNFVGFLAYQKRAFFKYLIILTFIISIVLYFFVSLSSGMSATFEVFWEIICVILPLSFILAISLTSFCIVYMIKPSKEVKLARIVLKKEKMAVKGSLTDKKENRINKRIQKLNPTSIEDKSNIDNIPNKNNNSLFFNTNFLFNAITIVLFIGVSVLSFVFIGISQSNNKTSFDTVSNNALTNVQDIELNNYSFNEYVVLFENSEYIILSPCVAETDEENIEHTTIYTCYQIKANSENVPRVTKSFENINIVSDYNNLAKYRID